VPSAVAVGLVGAELSVNTVLPVQELVIVKGRPCAATAAVRPNAARAAGERRMGFSWKNRRKVRDAATRTSAAARDPEV
jgi:hypothetical protein